MEQVLATLNQVVVGVCQLLAILVISIGVAKAVWIYVREALTPGRSTAAVRASRLELGHSFSLGLGFLIGGSILKTTLAPTWNDIGQLAAIIAIRTILNFFLTLDISRQTDEGADSVPPSRLWGWLAPRRESAEAETQERSSEQE